LKKYLKKYDGRASGGREVKDTISQGVVHVNARKRADIRGRRGWFEFYSEKKGGEKPSGRLGQGRRKKKGFRCQGPEKRLGKKNLGQKEKTCPRATPAQLPQGPTIIRTYGREATRSLRGGADGKGNNQQQQGVRHERCKGFLLP